MLFLEHQILNMKNIVLFKSSKSEDAVFNELQKAKTQMENYKMLRSGKYVMNVWNDESKILAPLHNAPDDLPQGWEYKKVFRLEHAVKTRHEGPYAMLGNSVDILGKYLSKQGYTPITGCYYVIVNEWHSRNDLDNAIIDIYVGVSGNIL